MVMFNNSVDFYIQHKCINVCFSEVFSILFSYNTFSLFSISIHLSYSFIPTKHCFFRDFSEFFFIFYFFAELPFGVIKVGGSISHKMSWF